MNGSKEHPRLSNLSLPTFHCLYPSNLLLQVTSPNSRCFNHRNYTSNEEHWVHAFRAVCRHHAIPLAVFAIIERDVVEITRTAARRHDGSWWPLKIDAGRWRGRVGSEGDG